MDAQRQIIANEVVELATELPVGLIRTLADAIASADLSDWPRARLRILEMTPQARLHALVSEFLNTWHNQASSVSPNSVALALLSAAATAQHERERQSVDLVWTGPDVIDVPLRRTDQALLQVIDAAQDSLLIVSFAVYKVPAVTQALIRAFERGVFIRICVEAPEPSGEHIAYDTIRALGPDVLQRAAIYIWPRDRRPTDSSGNAGSLHAKCAVADRDLLFISSANLTGYAMQLNMELGVLIRGGRMPATVATHFERLIERGVLERVEGS